MVSLTLIFFEEGTSVSGPSSAETVSPIRGLDEVLKKREDDGEVRMVHVQAGVGESEFKEVMDIGLRGHSRASEQRNIGRVRRSIGYIMDVMWCGVAYD